MKPVRTLSWVFLALTALGFVAPARAAFEADDYRAAIERFGPSLVSVQYVVNMNMFGQEQRQDGRGQGVLVDQKGLILVPDRLVNLEVPMFQMGDAAPAAASSASVRSSEFRVLLDGSDEWREAQFVTRAPDLGLAWLRLSEAPDALRPLDLDRTGEVSVGDAFLTVARAGEAFGYAAFAREGRALGQVRVPRRALISDSLPGIAVDAQGRFLGFVDLDMSFMSARGMSLDMTDFMMLLTPAARVATATRQALGEAGAPPKAD